jgi:hypothetical protein
MEQSTESREVLDELQIRRRRQRSYYLLRKRRRLELEAVVLADRIAQLKADCATSQHLEEHGRQEDAAPSS